LEIKLPTRANFRAAGAVGGHWIAGGANIPGDLMYENWRPVVRKAAPDPRRSSTRGEAEFVGRLPSTAAAPRRDGRMGPANRTTGHHLQRQPRETHGETAGHSGPTCSTTNGCWPMALPTSPQVFTWKPACQGSPPKRCPSCPSTSGRSGSDPRGNLARSRADAGRWRCQRCRRFPRGNRRITGRHQAMSLNVGPLRAVALSRAVVPPRCPTLPR